jgi:hypothetical protein
VGQHRSDAPLNSRRQTYCSTYDAIVDACCDAWNALMADPARITTIATRDWATVIA